MSCSGFITDYGDDLPLCRCPICKGWLPRHFPIDKPFRCKKCGIELMTFKEYDEEGIEMVDMGKICPIETPPTSIKSDKKRLV
jgi:hypothetical protein